MRSATGTFWKGELVLARKGNCARQADAQEVERQSRIINDPVVAEYVNRVGQNLVRNSDAKVPFTIKVIEETK